MTRIILLLLITIILNSCSFSPLKGLNNNTNDLRCHRFQQEVRSLHQCQTQGTLLFLSEKQRLYARFFWKRRDLDCYQIALINPFNGTQLGFSIESGVVYLSDNTNQNDTSDIPKKLIRKIIDLPIPIDVFCHWILGFPEGTDDYKLDEQCRLKELHATIRGEQWRVLYINYDGKSKPNLPLNIEFRGDNCFLKLKMDRWFIK